LHAMQALSQLSYTPSGCTPFGFLTPGLQLSSLKL
jgi:hypothetical protein